jgi:hypothetical protein
MRSIDVMGKEEGKEEGSHVVNRGAVGDQCNNMVEDLRNLKMLTLS